MKKMNKIALSIGALTTVVAPVAAVVSCGSTHKKTKHVNAAGISKNGNTNTEGSQVGTDGNTNTEGSQTVVNGNTNTEGSQTVVNGNTNTEGAKTQVDQHTKEIHKGLLTSTEQIEAYISKLLGDKNWEQVKSSALGKVVESFINKDADGLLALIKGDDSKTLSEKILGGATFFKDSITVPFLVQTLHDLVNSIDDDTVSTGLSTIIGLVTPLLSKTGASDSIVKLLPMASSFIGAMIKGDTLVKIKETLNTIIDEINFEEILNKIIKLKGDIYPETTEGESALNSLGRKGVTFSNLESVIVGSMIPWGNKDADGNKFLANGGIGLAQYFALVLAQGSKEQSDPASFDSWGESFKDSLDKLEKDLPGITQLAPSLRVLVNPLMVMLFEGIDSRAKNADGTLGEGTVVQSALSQMDLNLKADHIKEFVDQLHDGFVGLINKLVSISGAFISEKDHPGSKQIIDTLTNELIKIADKIDGKVTSPGYVKIVTPEDLYKNLTQAFADILDIDLSKLSQGAIDTIKKAFPSFSATNVLVNLVQLAEDKLNGLKSSNSKLFDTITGYIYSLFPGTDFSIKASEKDRKLVVPVQKPVSSDEPETIYA